MSPIYFHKNKTFFTLLLTLAVHYLLPNCAQFSFHIYPASIYKWNNAIFFHTEEFNDTPVSRPFMPNLISLGCHL